MHASDVKPIKRLPGVNGTLELYPDHVCLKWSRLQRLFHFGEKPLSVANRDITGVEMFVGQNALTNEFMRLSIRRGKKRSLIVIFQRRHHNTAMQVRDMLDDLVTNRDVLPVVRALQDEARK
ncbi:MAG: hypothetical protein IT323_13045 [Anaerolineae bacterium]|nr:hypothetical protein [Anaerolineae bacterium]